VYPTTPSKVRDRAIHRRAILAIWAAFSTIQPSAFLESRETTQFQDGLKESSTDKPAQTPRETPVVVMTVRGPIPSSELGLSLTHEHVTTDFIGAEKAAAAPRYDRDAAAAVVLPHLQRASKRGVRTIFECTPRYIGRDVLLLERLSRESGVHIVTNTGYYGAVRNRYLPKHAAEETADELAGRWITEWKDGIEGTGIRPGFIKLGVDSGKLPDLHAKLLRAGARAHLATGLTIAVHSGNGEAALDELRILDEEDVAPDALVWVHAQNGTPEQYEEVARRGAWVSLDGFSIAAGRTAKYVEVLARLRAARLLGRVLISHDDGWSVDGEAPSGAGLTLFGNGNKAPYSSIFTDLLPELERRGFETSDIEQFLVSNPRDAFTVRVRRKANAK
jgi:predicted metal-dependent phosphotriesterase family hydrolase